MTNKTPVGVALIGAGRIGSFHAESIARRIKSAELVAVADPAVDAARKLATLLDVEKATGDVEEILKDDAVEAVIIASPARYHAGLVEQAARAGKAVFCEKPMALTLEEADKAIAAANQAKVPLQIGFNRRWDASFKQGRDAIDAGRIGKQWLLRSLTRDPGPFNADPDRIPLWTIFYETLIHDFDTLLWLNPGAEPVDVFAVTDALVRPDAKSKGFLDTAVVTIRFDNGAIAVAEANFSASYGYDIRGEVHGSSGMVTMGEVQQSSLRLSDAAGVVGATWRRDTDRFVDAYTAQLASFVASVRRGKVDGPTGTDAKRALAIALASIESAKSGRPAPVAR